MARELNHFDKHKPPFIPVSRYGRDLKRDLGHVGFPNYYDYMDYSSSDDYGNGLPEYEIKFFNRENKTIEVILDDLEFLLDYDGKELDNDTNNRNDNDIIEKARIASIGAIASIDNCPSIEKGYYWIIKITELIENYNELKDFCIVGTNLNV